jgi:hypothetical protein
MRSLIQLHPEYSCSDAGARGREARITDAPEVDADMNVDEEPEAAIEDSRLGDKRGGVGR